MSLKPRKRKLTVKQVSLPKKKQQTITEEPKQHFRTLVNKQWDEQGEVTFSYAWKPSWKDDEFDGVSWEHDMPIEKFKEMVKDDGIVIFEVIVHPDEAHEVTKMLKKEGRLERNPNKIPNMTIFHGTDMQNMKIIKEEGRLRGWFIEDDPNLIAKGRSGATGYAEQQTAVFGIGRKEKSKGIPVVFEVKVPMDYVKPSGVNTLYLVPRGLDMGEGRRGEDNRDWIDTKYIEAYWTKQSDGTWIRNKWKNES